jgi:nickel/cobalt transporter (NicO) family protein
MLRLAFITLLLTSGTLAAHPLPNLRFDRVVHVRATSTGITVKYTLDLNDWTMAIDGNRILQPEDVKNLTGPQAYAKKYAERKAPLMADNFRAKLGDAAMIFRAEKIEIEPDRDHLRFRFQFRADWPKDHATSAKWAFEDENFAEQLGQITLTLDSASEAVDLQEVVEPVDLRGKASFDYRPGDEARSRRLAATLVFANLKPAPSAPVEVITIEMPKQLTLVEDLRERGVAAIFDHELGFGIILLLCGVFGAGHAFTPGHGKTMVAAYLVGERGTIWHAVVLGLTTTLAHTGSVIAVALVFRFAYGDKPPLEAQVWLSLIGGLLIAAVGFWLFVQRLAGRADHVHLNLGSPEDKPRYGWARVILLGLGGGIIPCYDAVLIFFLAANRGQLGAAIPMLFAFSTGLALVLVALGIGVVLANRAGRKRFAEWRVFRYLPVVSAFVLMALGLWFVRDAVQALIAAEAVPPTP